MACHGGMACDAKALRDLRNCSQMRVWLQMYAVCAHPRDGSRCCRPRRCRLLHIGSRCLVAMSYAFYWLVPNVACWDVELDIVWLAERPQTKTTWTKWVRVDVSVEPFSHGRCVPHFGIWSPDPARTKIVRTSCTGACVPILEFFDRIQPGETIDSLKSVEVLLTQTSSSSSDRHQDRSDNPPLLRRSHTLVKAMAEIGRPLIPLFYF